MSELKALTPQEQKDIFEKRGITFLKKENKRNVDKIQEIGYYNLKIFAYPFSEIIDENLTYKNISFEELLVRYYQDKNLRMYVLHAIEDIEVNLSNEITSVLGNKYGAFGYLDFPLWVNRKIPRFNVEKEQHFFKKDLLNKIKKSTLPDIKMRENQNDEGFPTVWLMVNVITFGGLVHIVENMSIKNKRLISKKYNCDNAELMSWLKCLNLIRNICAHNSDLIDIKLVTKPKVPEDFKEYLYDVDGNESGSLAVILCIIKKFMYSVNRNYRFHDIYNSTKKLIPNDESAHNLGFKSVDDLKNIIYA